MSVLICKWNSIVEAGIINAFKKLNYSIIIFNHPINNMDLDKEYLKQLSNTLINTPNIEFVFSINYVPIISKTCDILKVHYISWTVDSPSLTLYSKSMSSPYSHAFIFDYELYSKYFKYFPNNVHYLSLAGDVDFYDSISVSASDYSQYGCDISFVGSFHTEYCTNFDVSVPYMTDFTKGYIDALIETQLNIYGCYIIEDSITGKWADSFLKKSNFTTLPDYIKDSRGFVADHFIGFKCNQQDRIRTLKYISQYYNVNLYTTEDTSMLPNVNNCGIADSAKDMPKVFKCSKINLNMTARTIKSGIPQRIFDIMSAGGFVISNYQPEIPEYFIPDKDIVLYDSLSDLKDKIQYYLNNENERMKIARNGYNKIKQEHNCVIKLSELLMIAADFLKH